MATSKMFLQLKDTMEATLEILKGVDIRKALEDTQTTLVEVRKALTEAQEILNLRKQMETYDEVASRLEVADMTATELLEEVKGLSPEDCFALWRWESANKRRASVLEALRKGMGM